MKYWILLGVALGLCFGFVYGQDSMDVQTWGYAGCEHTMTTNHFELAPAEEATIALDLSGCAPEDLQGLLFFGYLTSKNQSRQLTSKNRILLSIDDPTQEEIASSDGSVMVQLHEGTLVTLRALNTNRRKSVMIRLRSESGL